MLTALGLWAGAAAAEGDKPIPPARPGTTGSILCEYFRGISGGSVADLTKHPTFPMSPTDSELIKAFEIPSNDEQEYGSVIRGYLTAPSTGNYTFWIVADDAGELYLSDGEQPEHRGKIASCPAWCDPHQADKFPEQKSQPIALEGGKRYYIEAWHKQEGGPGHLSVAWQLPDGKREMPIPGSRLQPAGTAKPAVPQTLTVKFKEGTPLATSPGQHKFPHDVDVSRGNQQWKMSYLLQMPNDYDKTQERKPLFVFLCGNSHQGENLEGILNEGPAQFYNAVPKLKEFWPFVGLFPQPPDGYRWDTPGMAETVVGMIDGIVAKYRIDPDRVYISGLSMGGKGTWLVAEAAPDRFAAVAPICAVSVKPEYAADVLRYTPTWIICGSDDGGFTDGSKQMAASLKAAGGPVQITVFPNEGHGVWARYYPDPRFYQWLLKQKREPAAAKKAAAATQASK
jgi:hypothetical protein